MIVSSTVRIGSALAALALVTGCSNPLSRQSLDNWGITYKIPVWQGVVVTQEMVEQLKPGMTKDQVRFVLGTPILTDPFHAERWDYPFRYQPGRGRTEERRFTVYFKDDRLDTYNGDSMPTEEEFAKSRNFATTKIVRGALAPLPQVPGTAPVAPTNNIGATVTPGRNPSTDRSTSPNDQPPAAPTNNAPPQ
jgi:outer membrane protein assembly factor BamE